MARLSNDAQVEDIHLQVASEDNGEGGRTVQLVFATPDGEYKTQFDIQGDRVKWVEIPLKIVDGKVCMG